MNDLNKLVPMGGPALVADGVEIFVPENVCPKAIRYSVKDGKLESLAFDGGCDGNLKALSKLLVGMSIESVIEKLSGITCGNKSTSCMDQLCLTLKDHA